MAKENRTESTLSISGMKCASCVAKVENALLSVTGVESASVNLVTQSATVTFTTTDSADLIRAIEEKGFGASLTEEGGVSFIDGDKDKLRDAYFFRLIISTAILGVFLGLTFWLKAKGADSAVIHTLQFFLILPVQFYCGSLFLRSAFASLKHGTTNMDTLVSLGTLTAFTYSTVDLIGLAKGGIYYETIVFLITFILLGKFLEERAKSKTSEALAKLVKLQAKEAVVLKKGDWVKTPIEEVKVGELVKIFPGEQIPVDGIVSFGKSHVDESMVSGEPVSVRKNIGDKVFGSTINREGELHVAVSEVGKNSLLAKIIRTVAEAQSKKASAQKLADRISSYFVPTIVALGLLTFTVWFVLFFHGYSEPVEGNTALSQALLYGISVWVIACPCALGLATPTVIMVTTGKGASEGILIRNIQALERSGEIDSFIFDKTGTLTKGKPVVEAIKTFGDTYVDEVFYLAASLEKSSNHPIAIAVTEKAREDSVAFYTVSDFANMPGVGVSGVIGRNLIKVVKPTAAELDKKAKDIVEKEEAAGKTVVVVVSGDEAVGCIVIADPLKKNAREVIEDIRSMGKETVLLTGDNELTANHIAAELEMDKVFARVMPEEKSGVVKKIQQGGKRVAMVGDGVNDAPALAVADVSFAMSSGSDIAIESADITLLRNDLSLILKAVRLSKLSYGKMKQNLFWALFYNVAAIPLAMGGFLSPEIAAAAMAFSSVSVVTNSLLLKYRKL